MVVAMSISRVAVVARSEEVVECRSAVVTSFGKVMGLARSVVLSRVS